MSSKSMAIVSASGFGKRHSRISGITQKRATYRIDLDLLERLNEVENKNHFVNCAIREKLKRDLKKGKTS